MKNVFLLYIPPTNHEAVVHYEDTIKSKIDPQRIYQYVNHDLRNKLERIFLGRRIAVWGSRDSDVNRSRFEKMKDGDDILINGVSIDNLSSSEQLKFGLQIVRALNGDFKVICVDGIESLDAESFEFFLKEIEDDSYQYFVTRVDGAHNHSIVIEDGEIKEPK